MVTHKLNTVIQFVELYEFLRQRSTGRAYRVPKSEMNRISKLIDILNDQQIYVGEYLRFCLQKYGAYEMYIPRICSEKVVNLFRRENPDPEANARMRINRQVRRLIDCHTNSGISIYELLNDEWESFTPLFRLTLARRFGYTDIVATYRDKAAVEQILDPRAASYLDDLLRRDRSISGNGQQSISPVDGVSDSGYSGNTQSGVNLGCVVFGSSGRNHRSSYNFVGI